MLVRVESRMNLEGAFVPYQGRLMPDSRLLSQRYICSNSASFLDRSLCCADAVVRGHRSGLLTTADYNNLCQCETLDDIKLNLVSRHRPAHDDVLPASVCSVLYLLVVYMHKRFGISQARGTAWPAAGPM